MAFFNSAVGVLQTLVIALGAGLGIWGVINLLEGYGSENPGLLMVNKEVQKQGKDRTPRCYSVQPRADSRTDSIRQRSRCPTHMRRR